jgi:uncharacterized protein (TIGR03435 family)
VRRGVLTIAIIIWSLAPAPAQRPPPGAAPAPSFEAASIKPLERGGRIDFRFFPNRFVATSFTLSQLIQQAYDIQPRELVGGPDWVRVDMFDVIATTAGEVSPNQMRLMLRSLLADRFQLLIEPETRTGIVYRLTARNVRGLNRPAKPDERSLVSTWRNDTNGVLSYEYIGRNATMAQLAVTLGEHVRAPVTDETKVSGNYDFRISWTYDEPIGGIPPDPNIPTIFTALERDLGLKLEPAKGPVPVHVIRSVSRPSPN